MTSSACSSVLDLPPTDGQHRPSPTLTTLLEILPAARRVLAVGGDGEPFAIAYADRHPGAHIARADRCPSALAAGAANSDLVVFPAGLESVADPLALFKLLAIHCPVGTPLFMAFGGASLRGSYHFAADDHAGQAKRGARAALVKLLMDAGWMPNLAGFTPAGDVVMVEAVRIFDPVGAAAVDRVEPARFAVVVPTNRDAELESNVQCSPGLNELQAPIYAVRLATSPAAALETARPHITQDWVLICHQDVYFPEGFGQRLNALLDGIAPEARERTLLGFIGKAADPQQGGYHDAGFVIDRLNRMDHAESATAVSIDELAIVIARDSLHRIDPEMGWHLWATDLCLTSICELETFPRIVKLPLFHNSTNESNLSLAFHESAARLVRKFPDFGPIPTLCGTIQPAAPGGAGDSAPPRRNGCCICGHAVQDWLPHPHIAGRSEFMKLLDAVGSDLAVYQCPECLSTDRDRHLWHYMNAVGVVDRMASMRVLHIAPERHIEALLLQVPPHEYLRGDLYPQQAGHQKLDVEQLEFEAGRFDLIICNHVLEHVSSPQRALAEFHRCLSPGGLLIAQTPYAPALRHTFETTGPVSPAFARLFYGQGDHVRLFGADIAGYFHAAGFSGDPLPHQVVLPGMDAAANGCNAREPFFCFSK